MDAALSLRRARPALGTLVHIDVQAAPPNAGNAASATDNALELAIGAAFAAISAVEQAVSFFQPQSELNRLHRLALHQAHSVSTLTWRLLCHADELFRASHGLFDASIGGRLLAQGLRPQVDARLPAADPQAAWADVELLADQRLRLHRPLRLDLSGLAKGYAVDQAITVLRQTPGIVSACVNAGGDLRHFGATQPLLLRHPADPGRLLPLGSLGNTAVATSGAYFGNGPANRADGRSYPVSPLVDPRRGEAQAYGDSITVIAEHCWLADGLTKVVALQGRRDPAASAALLARYDAAALIMAADGALQATPAFWQRLGVAVPEPLSVPVSAAHASPFATASHQESACG